MGLRIEYLHCNECRLPSTPSGRRILEYPDAVGPVVIAICEIATRWRRLGAGVWPGPLFIPDAFRPALPMRKIDA